MKPDKREWAYNKEYGFRVDKRVFAFSKWVLEQREKEMREGAQKWTLKIFPK